MPVSYYPSKDSSSAGYGYSGVSEMRDPGVSAVTENSDVINVKYFGEPIMSNVLALWSANNTAVDYQKIFICESSLNVGDPVRVDTSVDGKVVLATADTIDNAQIVGYCAFKPTTTSCNVVQNFRDDTTFSTATKGAYIYLTDAGGKSETPGTVEVTIGRIIASDEAWCQTPIVNTISGFSGFSGSSGTSGFSSQSGISGYSGISGPSGISGAEGQSGYSGFSGAFSGQSGFSGYSGFSGTYSGYSGYSGQAGTDAAPIFKGCEIYQPSGINMSYAGGGNNQIWSGYSGVSFDTSSMATNSSTITIVEDGYYLIQATHTFAPNTSYTTRRLRLKKNGSEYIGVNQNYLYYYGSGETNVQKMHAYALVNCVVGDYFQVEAYCSAGQYSYSNIDDISFRFSAILISGAKGDSGASGYSGYSGAFSGQSGWSGFSAAVSQVQQNILSVKTADQAVSTSSLTSITDIAGDLVSGNTYKITLRVPFRPYNAAGYMTVRMNFTGTASASGFYITNLVTNGNNSAYVNGTSQRYGPFAVNTNITNYVANPVGTLGTEMSYIEGYITVTGSGTLQFQSTYDILYSNTVTFYAGGSFEATTGSGAISGASGQAGVAGDSGTSGWSGFSGAFSGISGYSGPSGSSGTSGQQGLSGYSGYSGAFSGQSGWSGGIGPQGVSGYSGFSGTSGTSGFSGPRGYSGTSGSVGPTGTSGYSGPAGASGAEGQSGLSGRSGHSGISGPSGISGAVGMSGFSGYSGGSGPSGLSGYSAQSGYSGKSGISGYSGPQGAVGTSGYSGFSGLIGSTGPSGVSGYSAPSGLSGYSGEVGISGFSGHSGASGFSGAFSGESGYSGSVGASGSSGWSGVSGTMPSFVDTVDFLVDGGGDGLSSGRLYGWVYVPYDCTITGVTLLADTEGDLTLDIWRVAYANHPATQTNSICGSNLPSITNNNKAQPGVVGWSNTVTSGDALYFYVQDCSCITRVLVSLTVTRS